MQQEASPDIIGRNIERIIAIEERATSATTWPESVAETIGSFVGTLSFIAVHLVMIGVWIGLNTGVGVRLLARPLDPFPFNFLSTFVSIEAVVLTSVVLMKQKRMARLGDRREHLHLQVNLLAEQETSMAIQMLDRICRKLEIDAPENRDALELSHGATLENLVQKLHERLPDPDAPSPGGDVAHVNPPGPAPAPGQ